ncbi:hypothetical protein DICSQDRAFT_177373 [Dichomitus squalens LYAD-421 SS1]|uniref:uncharacterized protein n=1 Tax=Dichomitus squalens (strain LYAD-421) TaxID=732165 RepID=UPI0004412580|nr:uncharacterized protein DICSQDRAFT_177373 [Dichomitus squalens LYAD-421 SS1]EJF65977.1 hypothetical protein DICSQDRAFT_177373 [Dichomitus squalens LYAD-421 SS1]
MVDASVVNSVKSSLWNNFLSVVAFALLYYDYALTLGDEVEYFWKSAGFSLSSTLFVFNRYFGLIGTFPIVFEYFAHLPEHVCRLLQTYHQVFSVVTQGVIATILLLRTYALYERKKSVLVLLVVTLVAVALVCLVATMTVNSPVATPNTPVQRPSGGCDLALTEEQGIHLAIEWCAMLWFDTTVFLLTLARALRMHRRLSGGIVNLLFRDGTIYYGILVVFNVSNIITFLAVPAGSKKGIVTTLTNALSTTLTSRLVLNLRGIGSRKWDRRTADEENSTMKYRIPPNGEPFVSHLIFASPTTSLMEGSRSYAVSHDAEASMG